MHEHKADQPSEFSETLQALSQEINTLQREILRTSREKPGAPCTAEQSYAILRVEKYIQTLIDQVRAGPLAVNDTELNQYGNKHANLIRMARLVEGLNIENVHVPIPHGIKSDNVRAFMQVNQLDISHEWKTLRSLYASHDTSSSVRFLDRDDVKQLLASIQTKINQAFALARQHPDKFAKLVESGFAQWLSQVAKDSTFLMVRSTGAEDSRKASNAGGNKSCAYVAPTPEAFCDAAAEVICSYFEVNSLQNLVNSGLNPFENDPMLSVTAQQLVGEAPIGSSGQTTKPQDIPVSVVLFTQEPLYVGGEQFRVMRISATYGHGEGVVGGVGIGTDTILIAVSESNPDKINIMYENGDKSTRLAPVTTAEGIQLKHVKNPEELRNHPALNDEMITRLYTWGIVGEKFFQGPTDMELVIKGGKVYPVQGRPINRPEQTPTYLDVRKVQRERKETSPIIETMKGEMLVPGTASVVTIDNPEEILFVTRLAEATPLYKKGLHKAVVVLQPEPANSHDIVIFSGLGVPCLRMPQEGANALIKQADEEHSVVICMQEATMNLWDNNVPVDEYISSGYTVHPARIVMSSSVAIPGKPVEVPQEVKDLLLTVRSMETQAAANQALDTLQEHPLVADLTTSLAKLRGRVTAAKHPLPRRVTEAHTALENLNVRVHGAFEEMRAAVKKSQPEERLRPLFRAKVLSSLLSDETQCSCVTIQSHVEDAHALIDYQQEFDYPVRFADIYLAGNAAITDSSREAWRTFLKNLEPRAQSGEINPEQVQRLHGIVHRLEEIGVLETWFAFFFKPDSTLEELLQSISPQDEEKLRQLSNLEQTLTAVGKNLDAFSSSVTWADAQKSLESLVFTLTSPESPLTVAILRKNASPIVKMALFALMGNVVDVYDTAIKKMKGSPDIPETQKLILFKNMLNIYAVMFKQWLPQVGQDCALNRPENRQRLFNNNRTPEQFVAFLTNAMMRHKLTDTKNLLPSRDFSVAAASWGAETNLFST